MASLGAINPVLTAGLDGDNAWRLADYVKRGGYKGPEAHPRRKDPAGTGYRRSEDLCTARPRRRRFP